MTDELARVKTFTSRHEAELAKGALEASGIEATIVADDMGGTIPGLDLDRGVLLVVREADLEAARTALGVAPDDEG